MLQFSGPLTIGLAPGFSLSTLRSRHITTRPCHKLIVLESATTPV